MDSSGLQWEAMLAGLICGACMILVAYNAFLGLYTREKIYVSFSGLSVAVLLFQLSFLGQLTGLLPSQITDVAIPVSLLLATGVAGADYLRRVLVESGALKQSPAISALITISSVLILVFTFPLMSKGLP